MSKIVFKQWIYAPNKRSTPQAVSGMLNYIATRPGVEIGSFDEEMSKEMYLQYIATRPGVATDGDGEQLHGLFGKLHGMREIGDIEDLEIARGYVENLAHDKKTIYNAVVSMKAEDAVEKGMTDKASWSQFVANQTNDIAREMGIPPRNLEWVGAVHLEKDHPHVHLMYWDKEQSIGRNFVPAKKSNTIRHKMISDLYRDELKEIRGDKDIYHRAFVENVVVKTDAVLEKAIAQLGGLSPSGRNDLAEKMLSNESSEKILDRRTAQKLVVPLLNDINELDKQIKKEYPSGALKYQYLPKSVKKTLNIISDKVINQNPDIASSLKKYLDKVREQASFYGGKKNEKAYVDKAMRSIRKEIGNKILRTLKQMRQLKSAEKTHAYIDARIHQMMISIMQVAFDIINGEDAKLNNSGHSLGHDLTKGEKAELYKKNSDNSLDWGD